MDERSFHLCLVPLSFFAAPGGAGISLLLFDLLPLTEFSPGNSPSPDGVGLRIITEAQTRSGRSCISRWFSYPHVTQLGRSSWCVISTNHMSVNVMSLSKG